MLKCGTPLYGKSQQKNKDRFAFVLFFLMGPFALFNVTFYSGGFLNNIRFVAKLTKCKNDTNILKSHSLTYAIINLSHYIGKIKMLE